MNGHPVFNRFFSTVKHICRDVFLRGAPPDVSGGPLRDGGDDEEITGKTNNIAF